MIVDGSIRNAHFDYGKEKLVPFLQYRNVRRVETVIASHPHRSQIDGLVFLFVLNNDSVVLRLDQGSRSVLVTGDVDVELGSVNLAWSKSLRSSALKVVHA